LPELRRVQARMRTALHRFESCLPSRIVPKRQQALIGIEGIDAAEAHLRKLIEDGECLLLLAGLRVLAHLLDAFTRSLCERLCTDEKDKEGFLHARRRMASRDSLLSSCCAKARRRNAEGVTECSREVAVARVAEVEGDVSEGRAASQHVERHPEPQRVPKLR